MLSHTKPMTVFRITSFGINGERPAFAPAEDALSFEEAYRNFAYNNEVELFAELVTFNRMAFMFRDFDIPGFEPEDQGPSGEDVVRYGKVLEDGSIEFSDGQKMPVDVIWESFGLPVPEFASSYRF